MTGYKWSTEDEARSACKMVNDAFGMPLKGCVSVMIAYLPHKDKNDKIDFYYSERYEQDLVELLGELQTFEI